MFTPCQIGESSSRNNCKKISLTAFSKTIKKHEKTNECDQIYLLRVNDTWRRSSDVFMKVRKLIYRTSKHQNVVRSETLIEASLTYENLTN